MRRFAVAVALSLWAVPVALADEPRPEAGRVTAMSAPVDVRGDVLDHQVQDAVARQASEAAAQHGASAAEERDDSRSEFRSVSDARALALVKDVADVDESAAITKPKDVTSYINSNLAVADIDGTGRDGLILSTTPMRDRDADGKQASVSTLLEGDGHDGLEPANALNSYVIDRDARDGIDFGAFTVRDADADADSRAVADADLAFFPDVSSDTDELVASRPDGVETIHSLRSPAAAEDIRLRFDLPSGAHLTLVTPPPALGDGFDLAGTQFVAVVRDGRQIGTLAPPVAWDAQHRRIPVSLSQEGDSVTMHVPHREGSYEYPVVVDPYVYEDQQFAQGSDFAGWKFSASRPNIFAGYQGNAGYGVGLNVYNGANVYYNQGDFGQWYYQAPTVPGFESEGAFVYKADFGAVTHSLQDVAACAVEGIYRPDFRWESPQYYRGPQTSDTVLAGPSVDCGLENGNYDVLGLNNPIPVDGGVPPASAAPGNYAVFQYQMRTAGTRPAARIMYTGRTLVHMSDRGKPHINVAAPTTWTSSGAVKYSATDYGLGMRSLQITAPNSATPKDPLVSGCPANNQRLSPCPPTLSDAVGIPDLPEGSFTAQVTATDAVGNSASQAVPLKIDAGPPHIELSTDLGGDLESDNNVDYFVGPSTAPTVHLRTAATDDGAGMQNLTLSEIDPNAGTSAALAQTSQACAADRSCPKTESLADYSLNVAGLNEGRHTYSATGNDGLGNPGNSGDLTVLVDRSAPPAPQSVALDDYDTDTNTATVSWFQGSDPDLSDGELGSGVTRSEYRVSLAGVPVTDWTSTTDSSFRYSSAVQGTQIQVEVRAFDAAGNMTPTTATTLTVPTAPLMLSRTGSLVRPAATTHRHGRAHKASARVHIPGFGDPHENCGIGLTQTDADGHDAVVFNGAQTGNGPKYAGRVVVHAIARFQCEDDPELRPPDGLRLSACLKAQNASKTGWYNIMCDKADQRGVSIIDIPLENLCEPGTRAYRVHIESTQVFDKDTDVNKSGNYGEKTLDCDETKAWRFQSGYSNTKGAKVVSGWSSTGQPSTRLGTNLINDTRPRPTTTPEGWAAHHVIPANFETRGQFALAMKQGYVCNIDPNEAPNGVWLRANALRDHPNSDAFNALTGDNEKYRRRAFHPRVHTKEYSDEIVARLAKIIHNSDDKQTAICKRSDAENVLIGVAEQLVTDVPGKAFPWRPAKGGPAYPEDDLGGDD